MLARMISAFEERRGNDGTFELHTTHGGSAPSLAVRGIRGDAARTAAKILLELVDGARDEKLLVEQGDRWIVPLGGLRLQVAVKREGGFLGLGRPKVIELRDVAGADASVPTVALSCALTAHGLAELRSAPLLARQMLDESLSIYRGDASFPDDLDAPFVNHNNHLAYLALAKLAEGEGELERADELFGQGLRRSWSAQMRIAGGRLEKIEKQVPREILVRYLDGMAKGTLRIYDDLARNVPRSKGVAFVPSPILTFGGRGHAVQQIMPVPEPWTELFYEGAGRAAANDPATTALVAEALDAHSSNVAPLVRAAFGFKLFDESREARELETELEYFPPYQLWTSVLALVVAWTAVGLSTTQIRALLVLERDAELRRSAAQAWQAHQTELDEQALALLASPPS